MKITDTSTPFQSDTKRFYAPNILIEEQCPTCRVQVRKSLSDHYLSYPSFNKPMRIPMYCANDHEFEVCVVLRLTVEPAPEEP